MKRLLSLFILFFICFLAGCRPAPEPVLLDSFEGQISSETVDFGSADNSEIIVTASQDNNFCGNQSLKITYRLAAGGYMWAARGYGLDVEGASAWLVNPEDIEWNRYKAVSIAMYGQNSGAIYAFDLKDKGGEIWRTLIDDDFQGWQEISLPFQIFFSRKDWQPDQAEVTETLDFPVMSYQFEPLVPGEREVYFDCIKITAR